MKNLFAMLCLFVCACGSTSMPQPATARAETITVPAKGSSVDAGASTTQTVSGAHWSIEIPSTWKIGAKDDKSMSTEVVEAGQPRKAVIVVSQPVDSSMSPEEWVAGASSGVVASVPKDQVLNVRRGPGMYKGHACSVTQIVLEGGLFIGALAVVDEKLHVGYVVGVVGAISDGKELAGISQTFTIK
jgi:hypothetical protein